MNIIGTSNLTQQVYTLVKHLTSSHKEGKVLYWLFQDAHEAEVASETFSQLASLFHLKLSSTVLDHARADFTNNLFSLNSSASGLYCITVDTFVDLDKALSLLKESVEVIEVGKKYSPQQIAKKLSSLGYSRHQEDYFSYSLKGELLTIHQGGKRIKIRFAFDEVETITDGEDDSFKSLSIIPAEVDLKQLCVEDKKHPQGINIYDPLSVSRATTESDIVFAPFKVDGSNNKRFDLVETRHYQKDFQEVKTDIEKFLDNGFSLAIGTIDQDVLKTAFKREKISLESLSLLEQTGPLEGFIDQEAKFVLFSHADIFGRKQIKQRKRRDDSAFVTKLSINDYVVHEDHGIARYKGLSESVIEGHKRENLVLEYAKGDKLYVPVEMAYKVDKYIGEAKPKLQRLSGTSWVKMSRKASQESQQFARDLLKLYAQRSLVTVDPWVLFPDADKKLHESFPYTETPDQEMAIQDVYKGLTGTEPMDQLVVGDVGFGKTEVAIRAAYQAVLNHKQVAVLCPTTLLAQQHYDTFSTRLSPLGAQVEMLSRFTGKVEGHQDTSIKKVLENLQQGKIDIVIGTHRLLSKDIDFHNIGLIIIDEEQRFGVKHKEKLKQLRSQAHILTLSATPIPRTLYFSLSGLRDISTIKTPPLGRQPIDTEIQEYSDERVKKAIQRELKRGGQAFYLYNKVQTIQTMKKKLQGMLGAKVKIDIVHGQMPADEMARVAAEFGAGKIDVLVCTTIIENGLDLPNVNTLIVHNATRFGIGQLYQIRGRIGRGSVKAYALFLYPEAGMSGVAAQRLQILEEAKELGSGFQLAMRDLEMRGMGQMLGTKQHGQIQKVGLSLYGKLLRQAVEELETGEVQKEKAPIIINLPVDYGVPDELIYDSEERVRFYRLLSQVSSIEELDDILTPYRSQISELSAEGQNRIHNLIRILQLRFHLDSSPLKGVDYQEIIRPEGGVKKQLELSFKKLNTTHVDRLIPLYPDFKVVENSIVVDAEHIREFLDEVEKIIIQLGR